VGTQSGLAPGQVGTPSQQGAMQARGSRATAERAGVAPVGWNALQGLAGGIL
jgi:hypothetical protein